MREGEDILVGNGIPNTSADAPDLDPKPAYDEVDVMDVVEPFADVVDPLLRLPKPNVDCELDEFFLRITFLGFLSDFSEEAADPNEGEGRDVDEPIEKAGNCLEGGHVLDLLCAVGITVGIVEAIVGFGMLEGAFDSVEGFR